jgi:aminoglycoside 3-N-acetyltransferase
LLIGVNHSKNTSLHLAEYRANYAGKHDEEQSSAILIDGVRQWVTYTTLAVQDEDFATLGDAYEVEHHIPRHKVGNAEVRFMRQRPFVDWAVKWMEQHRVSPA